MDTHSPPASLTAAQVIAEVRKRTGITITISRLGHWASAGLLPSPSRQGKRGERGVTWRWDTDCAPRAALIARTLADGKRSLKLAIRALVVKDYPPRADVLRADLLDCVKELQQGTPLRRPYLKAKMSQAEQRRRFKEGLRRHHRHLPQPFLDSAVDSATAIAGLASPTAHDPISQNRRYLDLASIATALTEIDAARLVQAYHNAATMVAWFEPLVMALGHAILPAPKKRTSRRRGAAGANEEAATPLRLGSVLTDRLPDSIHLTPSDIFRVPLLLTCVAHAYYGDPEPEQQLALEQVLAEALAVLAPPAAPSDGSTSEDDAPTSRCE